MNKKEKDKTNNSLNPGDLVTADRLYESYIVEHYGWGSDTWIEEGNKNMTPEDVGIVLEVKKYTDHKFEECKVLWSRINKVYIFDAQKLTKFNNNNSNTP